MATPKIWLLEEDAALAEILAYNLREAGFTVTPIDPTSNAWRDATSPGDVLIVDLPSPAATIRAFCWQLHDHPTTRQLVIIALTSHDRLDPSTPIADVARGADDYVAKPFRIGRLLERLRCLSATTLGALPARDQTLVSQGLLVDPQRKLVHVGEIPVAVTRSELQILHVLMRQPGRAWDRPALIEEALGGDALILERTIDVHIRSLRKKLGSAAWLIETVRGVGYRFHDPRWHDTSAQSPGSADEFDDHGAEEIDSDSDGH